MTLLEALYIRQTTDLLNGLLTNNDSKSTKEQVLFNNTSV